LTQVVRTRSKAPSASPSQISPTQAIAPALTIGLKGRLSAPRQMELNASPLGSTSTTVSTLSAPSSSRARAKTKAFEIDWMLNSTVLSPTS
jgi:hypothetical protein